MSTLKTLDRGLTALTIIAQTPEGISIANLAKALSIDRAIAYRIVATLSDHHMVVRHSDGQLHLGAAILGLERQFEPQFRARARPFLHALAQTSQATAFITLAQHDQAAAILVCEPDNMLIRVGYRVGSSHPLSQGAAGLAILAGRAPTATDSAAVTEARAIGYALTQGVLQSGAIGVACPIGATHSPDTAAPLIEASVGVVALMDLDVSRAIDAVQNCARQLAGLIAS